jgi:hypothetical protein
MQLAHCVGKVQNHLRDVGARLDIPTAFQFEDVTLGA